VAAALRMCISSPMVKACAISAARSIGPSRSSTADKAGATASRIQRRPFSVSGPWAPKRSWWPQGPSAMNDDAVVRFTASSTTRSGVPGEMTPAIGPTAPREWQGAKAMSPEAASASASSAVRAQPSNSAAALTAPRIGQHMRAHSIGGPACSRVRPSSPSASRADRTAVHAGRARQSRSSASRLAAAMSAMRRRPL